MSTSILTTVKKGNRLPFRGVSVVKCSDFLQLPPVMDRRLFQLKFAENLWIQLFKFHELTEIVIRNSDLEFAEILNRIWEREHTYDDVEKINALAETDISTWPQGFVKVYVNPRQ